MSAELPEAVAEDFALLEQVQAELQPLREAGVSLEDLVKPLVDPLALAQIFMPLTAQAYGVQSSEQLSELLNSHIMPALVLAHDGFLTGYRYCQLKQAQEAASEPQDAS